MNSLLEVLQYIRDHDSSLSLVEELDFLIDKIVDGKLDIDSVSFDEVKDILSTTKIPYDDNVSSMFDYNNFGLLGCIFYYSFVNLDDNEIVEYLLNGVETEYIKTSIARLIKIFGNDDSAKVDIDQILFYLVSDENKLKLFKNDEFRNKYPRFEDELISVLPSHFIPDLLKNGIIREIDYRVMNKLKEIDNDGFFNLFIDDNYEMKLDEFYIEFLKSIFYRLNFNQRIRLMQKKEVIPYVEAYLNAIYDENIIELLGARTDEEKNQILEILLNNMDFASNFKNKRVLLKSIVLLAGEFPIDKFQNIPDKQLIEAYGVDSFIYIKTREYSYNEYKNGITDEKILATADMVDKDCLELFISEILLNSSYLANTGTIVKLLDRLGKNNKTSIIALKVLLKQKDMLYRDRESFEKYIEYLPQNIRDLFIKTLNSNSLEMRNLGHRMLFPAICSRLSETNGEIEVQDLNEISEKLEGIFLKNNMPFLGKLFLCFRTLYPTLEEFNFDRGDMSTQLQTENILKQIFKDRYNKIREEMDRNPGFKKDVMERVNEVRFRIMFNDLLRIAVGSNNRSLKEYIENIEIGNNIFLEIQNGTKLFEMLSPEEIQSLEIFASHLEMLYSNMQNQEDLTLEDKNLKEKLEIFIKAFKPTDRHSLPDRIVRSFCFNAGYKSFEELKQAVEEMRNNANKKNTKNAEELEDATFKLEKGDFVRGIGTLDSIPSLNDGNVCKEFLGPIIYQSSSDLTPLDTDWSRITKDNPESIMDAIYGTPTGDSDYGYILFVIKSDNSSSACYNITRSKDEVDLKYDPKKIEMFKTKGDNHYGARTGTSTADIDYIIFDAERCNPKLPFKDDHNKVKFVDVLSAIKFELAKAGFYIPIVNMEGKLIFTKEEYEEYSKRLNGLKYYGHEEFVLPEKHSLDLDRVEINNGEETITVPSTEELIEMIKEDDKQRISRNEILFRTVSEFITKETSAEKVYDHLTGDLTDGLAELISTGSTSRGSCTPGDADYDYMLRLDVSESPNVPKIIEKLIEKFQPKVMKSSEKDRFRGEGITNIEGLEDVPVDIDISFTDKTNKMEYSTDAALAERMNAIKKQHPEEYYKIRANILAAKLLLKQAHCYKAYRSDQTQGGLGGVGVENWILQNHGSLLEAIDDFLEHAIDKETGDIKDYHEFKKTYKIWDPGANHEAKTNYPYDEFIEDNTSEEGYIRMCKACMAYKLQHGMRYDPDNRGLVQ